MGARYGGTRQGGTVHYLRYGNRTAFGFSVCERYRQNSSQGRIWNILTEILDGLYSWDEYKVLKKEFGDNLTVVAIATNSNLRYERLSTREIRPLTREEAVSRDHSEIENLAKGGPIAIADYYIVNNSDLDSLKAEFNKFLNI